MGNGELDTRTLDYVKHTSLEKRKKLGQYMTPRSVSNVLLNHLPIKAGDKVLDPAVGTGELLKQVLERNPDVETFGWDIDGEILKVAKTIIPDSVLIEKSGIDPLTNTDREQYDVVIANPPYFEMKPDADQKTYYKDVISGRANIFSFFFQQALDLVKEGGYVGFIVPPSLNAGAFFKGLRAHVLKHSNIEYLELIRKSNHFVDAQTAVQIIVLRKTRNSNAATNPYVFSRDLEHDVVTVFTEDKKFLTDQWEGKKSLHELGFTAVTGTIPWNEYKEDLSDNPSLGFPLIYAKDISKDNTVVLSKALEPRRYLKTLKRPPIAKDVIIVNRIVGALSSPTIRLARYSGVGKPFYAENHVNVILPTAGKKPEITLDELYVRITENTQLVEYIKRLTGNTQLSSKELTHLLPI